MSPAVLRPILPHEHDTTLHTQTTTAPDGAWREDSMPQRTKRLSYFSVLAYHLTGGHAYRGGPDSPAGFLKLTTTGRKSGVPRTVHLLYIRDGAAYVLTASNGGSPRHPGWFFNLHSNPQVTIEVHGIQRRAVAEVAGLEKRRELWARLLEIAPLYAGYETRTQREIPMVLVRPLDTSEAGQAV
jgi:deazaflavin-dependent oxidoreductase (nitroreductase family)